MKLHKPGHGTMKMNVFVLQVVILLFGSIALPILFGGFRLAINHPDAIFGPTAIETRRNYIFYSFLSLLLLPFHSALLQLKLHKIELMLRNSPRNKTLLLQKDRITRHQRNFSKVEIGLETIYQMVLINLCAIFVYQLFFLAREAREARRPTKKDI